MHAGGSGDPALAAQAAGSVVDAQALIDRTPIARGQWVILAVCVALGMVEGFDLQVMALVAPEISREWKVAPHLFGPVFSVALFGGILGGFAISSLGGRVGPKASLVASILVFSLTTLLCVFATSLWHLALLRAIAGVGFGAAIPGLVAIVSNYMPQRVRSVAVTATVSAQMLGGVFGGLAMAPLVPRLGWEVAFLFGGVMPLLLLPFLVRAVPEHIPWLIIARGDHDRVAAILAGLDKGESAPATRFSVGGSTVARISLGEILTRRYLLGALALWATCVAAAVNFYMLVNWLPTMLREGGWTVEGAILGSVALNAGGFIGALLVSRMMDRGHPYLVLTTCYFAASLAILLMVALQGAGPEPLMVVAFVMGFLSLGSFFSITALNIHYFPPHLLGVATGCALVFARIGAVLGPLAGSYVLATGGGAPDIYMFAAAVSVTAATTTWLMARAARRIRATTTS